MTSNVESKLTEFSENAIKVLEKRYLKRDKEGNPLETPYQLFERVAKAIGDGDLKYGVSQEEADKSTQKFLDFMLQKQFMPNSPTLMNAGRELGQLSACFVLPVEDSLSEIFETIKNTALIHKSGGGTGFNFTHLRPKNDIVRSTMGVSSGPVSFMEVFNAATEAIKQGGTRRGANMGILRVDHPDILEFINAKYDGSKLNNFNISVGITDKFMDAVSAGEDYDLVHPKTGKAIKRVNAKQVFDLIIDHAWRNGEPGIVFLDKMNADNPTPHIGVIESTNPCGEVPLLPYEACNLGSINLGKFIKDGEILWDELAEITKTAIHFLDNVITVNNYPLPQISDMVQNNRKIGLGVMGWADMLMMLDIPYNSEEGVQLGYKIFEFIDYHSKVEAIRLAEVRGPFKNFKGSIYDGNDFLTSKYKGKSCGAITDEQWAELDAQIAKVGIRNATTTCIAPTGTISMIAGASGGVEPLFGLVFIRNVMDGTIMVEANPIFEERCKKDGVYSEELMQSISANHGSLKGVEGVPADIAKTFATAHDVSPEYHVKMQAAYQLHCDNAVSKTVNFEEDATREDIAEVYFLSYKYNLKGTTVYRNNSRTFQPMNTEVKKDEHNIEVKDVVEESEEASGKLICPECKSEMAETEGCALCMSCGYSPCK